MTTNLQTLSDALAAAVAAVAPSVVRLKAHKRHVSSGVALAADLVVTTHADLPRHAAEIPVLLDGGRESVATIVGREPSSDLALLKVRDGGLAVPVWSDSTGLRVGDLVLAIGRPTRSIRALWGIIGGLDGAWETALGGSIDRYIDVDAQLRWGFSGGPLVDGQGRVIGINSAALTSGGTTIPAETARRVAERLRTHGSGGGGGFLGIGAHGVTLPAEVAKAAGQTEAALVVSVEPNGPAAKAGVLLGDALVAVDGSPTRSVSEVAAVVGARAPGETVTLKIVRAGAVIDVKATLGSRG